MIKYLVKFQQKVFVEFMEEVKKKLPVKILDQNIDEFLLNLARNPKEKSEGTSAQVGIPKSSL